MSLQNEWLNLTRFYEEIKLPASQRCIKERERQIIKSDSNGLYHYSKFIVSKKNLSHIAKKKNFVKAFPAGFPFIIFQILLTILKNFKNSLKFVYWSGWNSLFIDSNVLEGEEGRFIAVKILSNGMFWQEKENLNQMTFHAQKKIFFILGN